MNAKPYHVLFLCTANSARSILAEAVLNGLGDGRFIAHSAGSMPRGQVHPMALTVLAANGYAVAGLRSKSWDEFGGADAPVMMDFVFTVCDNAANELCPIWPGQPISAHWGMADPAGVGADEAQCQQAFETALLQISRRIRLFADLPHTQLERTALAAAVRAIAADGAN